MGKTLFQNKNKFKNVLSLLNVKCTLSGLGKFLETESLLKIRKCFLFHLRSSFRSQDIRITKYLIFIFKFYTYNLRLVAN